MEVQVLRNEKELIEFKLKGEDNAFSNLLLHQLLEDSDVDIAQYDVPHPDVDFPTFYVKVKKGSAASAVERALAEIKDQAESLVK